MANNEEKLLDYLKRVTADLRQTQRRLKDVESASHEPVAIVGMACRFPGGVRSPEELWELVAEGRDAVSEMPTDRNWDLDHFYDPDPEHPGTSYAREGGFLDDPAGFDAAFFGISPREALGMAPQQRLALEASWEAIEHAGINPESLRGSQTGTFIGCDHLDYVSDESQVPEGSAGYFTIGNSASVVSGRVAYTLGLEGAAVTVDTACSSSLVAMHLACQAIRQGECDMALAGGAAVMSSTAPFIGFSELRGLAPDGRSKPFSQSADGISMAEGVGVLLLQRLSDARRNGHQVLAVIRGTAVNQDGASNGLTAPNGPAQQRVIRQALANARLTAADVDAVEAHGTGTALGDPIEAQALLATYGQDRPADRPLWLGSIKSNIGHSQMAAGAAGVIKMVLAMRHQTLPASLHIDEPTQHVDWSSGAIQLLTEAVAWPEADHPRRAGVSSFGISGTNAHVVLEQAPLAAEFSPDDPDAADGEPAGDRTADAEPAAVTEESPARSAVGGLVPWLVSARSAAALRGQARALAERVTADPDLSPLDVGWSLATTRAHFEHRAVVVGDDRDALLASLRALAEGDTHPALITPTPRPTTGDTVFLFSGQGSQRPGMGRELYDRFPAYAQTFDQVCDLLDPYLDHPLRDVVFTGGPDDLLNHTTYAQAGLFALQVAMARLLESLGVRPDAVIGHSIGEVAAAHIAGILDLPDACHLVAQRATLMGSLPPGGAMATLNATPEELQPHLTTHEGQVSIAALNTPGNTVISGPTEAVEAIRTHWVEQGRKARSLAVSHAFHSPQMDPILDPFTQALTTLTFHPPTIPLISNLTGQPADPDHITTPTYWAQHIRQPVHFHQAITHTAPTTHTYLELGPDPTLTTATQHTLHHLQSHPTTHPTHSPDSQATGDVAEVLVGEGHSEGEAEQERTEPLVVAALQRKQGDVHAFTRALAQLHAAGAPLNWPGWFPADPAPRVVGLPTYAFQHQRFWLESPVPRRAGGTGVDAAESQLWHAIEELDVEALSSTLKLDQGSPGFDALLPALPVLSAWRRQHRERSVVDSWRYEVSWKRLADAAPAALSGAWLLVVPAGFADHPAVQTAAQALTGHGVSAVDHLVVAAGDADRSGLAGEIGERVAGGRPAGVLSLLALDETAHPAHPGVPAGLAATIALVRALGDAAVSAPLWCLTQGAVATGAADPLPHPRQAQVWGLGRVAALEHADRWGGLIDLPTTIDHHTARRLATLLAPGQAEDQVAIRGAVFARRLRQAPGAADDTPWQPTGTTLITGGTGGLGARVARWLAENGAPRLLLASRSGPDAAGAGELATQLTALGAAVDIVSCDVADRDQLQRLLADIPADQPLSAVVHTAGVLEVDTLAELDLAALDRTLGAKAVAAAHLHELTRDLDLSAFVLFSSNAATWGSGRQAGYAAANAYLDALAEHRRAHGLPATSIAWGPWGGTGMAADEAGIAYLKRRGLSPLDPRLGIASLQAALGRGDTTITVADVDWEKFTTGFTAQRPSPLLSDVAPAAPVVAEAVDAMAASPLRQQLAEGTPADQHRVLLEHVQRHAATILGHPSPDAVSPTVPFQELGFDSITAVELRNQLATSTGITIAPTLVFDHPTPHAVATYLRGQLTGQRATAAARPASVVGSDELIAIVGMACRYPGGVRSPRDLWELVVEGRDAIAGMPTDRNWDLDTLFHPDPEHLGTSYANEGGFLYEAAEFDAAFFGISPREALAMDPQQRLLLETAWETFESAGLDRDALNGSDTGVFAGGTFQGYGATGTASAQEVEGYLLAGGTPSVLSGRLAYSFGLEGPAMTVDTACSSSLVAMHLAAQALRQGECGLALAGGVTVMATPTTFVEFSRQRGLAADGRCKPFAAAADGTGWGEGAGLVLLERLSDARRNGRRVLAVLRGSAINQDGTSNGLTAPNGPSQQRVIGQALANARLSPAEVDVVEAHGTGTTLGDPIEAQALLATYGQDRPEGQPLWLGSIKSNIGHTQAASGVAGVIKMVEAMRHGVLPASLHIDAPTPHVDWDAGEVRLLTERAAWPQADRPRRAGVSSFGISGTNAHLILEQPPAAPEPAAVTSPAPVTAESTTGSAVGGPVPWLVSARSATALRGQAKALAERVTADPDLSPLDVGWSLATTRAHFEHRAVAVGENHEQLLPALTALANGDTHPHLTHPDTEATAGTGDTVFLFSGQGSQRPGMGRELYDRFPAYAQTFDQVCDLLDPYLDHPLRDVVFTGEPDALLDHTTYAQAGLFALQVAMARLLETLGVRPDAVIGHSIGEVAAAHIAGILDLPDACHLVAQRATLMGSLPPGGAMATLNATPEELQPHLTTYEGQVSIAALNTPGNTVISGPTEAVEAIRTHWVEQGRKARSLAVSHAFHSPQMDPILDAFTQSISTLTFHAPVIPLISNLTGQPADPDFITTPTYWAQHIRQPVHFHQAITHTAPTTHTYLELGPDPTLTTATQHTLHHLQSLIVDDEDTERPAVVVAATLSRKKPEAQAFAQALGALHTHGVRVDWTGWFPVSPAPRVVELPTYAFQHQRFWLAAADPVEAVGGAGQSAAEVELWDAVERGDLAALARTLGSPEEQQPMLDAVLPTLSAWRRQHRERSVIDSWRYRAVWTPITDLPPAALDGSWLLVVPVGFEDHPVTHIATQALSGYGASVVRYLVTGTSERDEVTDGLDELAVGVTFSGVVSLLALDEEPHPDYPAVPTGLAATTTLIQALNTTTITAPLWTLTQGATTTHTTDPLPNPHQAHTWGLGRVAALEHPHQFAGLIDLPTNPNHHTTHHLATLLTQTPNHTTTHDQTAIRTTPLTRRLHHTPTPTTTPNNTPPSPWKPTGTTLITGGTGALATHITRWLAHQDAPHIILTSRTGPNAPHTQTLTQELNHLNTTITITTCDISNRNQLQQLLNTIPTHQPLTTIIHTAGATDTEYIADLGLDRLQHVLRPKALGALHLHELTREMSSLSAFVLFSSGAATWGGSHQGAYAAANTYLDALAEHRRAHGLPATSIAWGPWGEAGMAADDAAVDFYSRRGMHPLPPELAVKALHQALTHNDTTITIADIDWHTFPASFTAQRPSPLLADLTPAGTADTPGDQPASAGSALARQLADTPPSEQQQVLVQHVQALAAAILGHPHAEAIPAAQPFQEMGFDSLTAVELRNQLASSTGLNLPPSLVFDHPTPTALARYLRAELTGRQEAADEPAVTAVAQDEPIAIVGMACRYPGDIDTPQGLWDLVMAQRDAISEMPTNRNWDLGALFHPDPDHQGTSYVREGGFLHDAPEFDAAFFGISPREALAMDPQQRLLLETAWETFESAGLDRDALNGSDTGVFAGVTSQDYLSLTGDTASDVEGYVATGNIGSVVSGRVAYSFGLEGPAMTVDTACSSSLVAMHLAAQALRQGECSLALAGGVTVMATPGAFIEFSRQRGLAANARCKPFADAADGMVWGEGAGLVLLERLSDARRNGHEVLAVVRGSAVNQDGTSNGLSAPNGPSQQRVIRQALANARLAASDVDAVEAHGTGTTLGDPIEAQALLATYGQDRPDDRPLLLGSIKSNIGHTQAAAGVASVIKMVQAMRHGVLPASLHIDAPSTKVDWGLGDVRLLAEPTAWPQADRPRRAGVSSFGISGTNAHLILEQPPQPPEPARHQVGGAVPWLVSARGDAALRGQAEALVERLTADPGLSPVDVGWTLLTARTSFEHRAVVVGEDREELLAGLTALARGETHRALVSPAPATATTGTGNTVFLFSGQGSQRPGMGRELYDRFPAYAETFDQVCDLLDPYLDHPLRDVVFTGGPDDLLNHTTYAQAGLFALQVAMARLLETLGVRPDAVIGHSIGEVAAAHIAGILDLPDACHLVAQRATLMGSLPPGGAMATLNTTPEELQPHLTAHDGQVSIAALNTPGNTVISGPTEAVEAIRTHWAEQGRKTRSLTVSHAFHSPQMDPILDPFTQALTTLTFHPPTIPLISNLTGQPADPDFITTPTYWAQHIRQPVHFHQAITHTAPTTHTYLELGPDPTLTTATQHTVHHLATEAEPALEAQPLTIATLSRKQSDVQGFGRALGQLHANGVGVEWAEWFPAAPQPRVVALPTYAFQRQRFWVEPPAPRAGGGHGADVVEERLWQAIEELDVDTLSSTLNVQRDSPTVEALMPALPVLSTWRREHREQSTIDSWRYGITWEPIPESTSPVLAGPWLLVLPSGFEEHPAVRLAREALDDHGALRTDVVIDCAVAERQVVAGQLERAAGSAGSLDGVVSLLALDEEPHPDYPAVPTGLAATTTLIQALNTTTITAPLWTLTQGATTTHTTDPLPNPHQAHTWGLGRVAALEHPHHIAGLIDLPTNPNHHTTHHLATLLAQTHNQTHPTHDQTAIRTTPLTRRLHHTPTPNNPISTPWKPTGTTLITGGTGALATHITRWLAHQDAPHIILTSRTGPNAPHTQTLTQELNHLNTTITITTCDISNRNQLQQLLNTIPTHQPLTTIIHTAGIAENTPFEELDLPHLDAVLRPKSLGALHLHELTREMKDVSAFVLFSSGAATWGGSRQGAYAAANTYLDALAEHRRAHGLPATSIAWAPWAESGMAADDAASAYYSRRGMHPLPPELAVKALHQALTHNDTTITIADIDWHTFPASFTAQRPSPLLAHLAPAPAPAAEVASGQPAATSALAQQLADSTPGQQQQIVLHHIQTTAAQILGHASIDAVPATQPFQDLGFDSLTAVELRNQLASSTGLDLTPALIFDHPTPKELADFLREQLADEDVASEGRLLTELDRWDAASESADVDEAARRRITGRLQLLLAKWSDTGRETDRSAAHSDLEAASAEDIFDLISDEFGKS